MVLMHVVLSIKKLNCLLSSNFVASIFRSSRNYRWIVPWRYMVVYLPPVSLRPDQSGPRFEDNIFKCIWLNGNICIRFHEDFSQECNWQWWSTLHGRHDGRDSVSNHQPHDCLHNRLFRRRSNNTSKLRVTGLGELTGDQLRGKCFHLRTSSCQSVA